MAIDTKRLRSIIGGSAGNLVEWYDWYSFTIFAIYFAPAFFPKADPLAQLLNTAGIFWLGFAMRPIGAWLMGMYGDRRGRKAGLTLSVALMAGGSLVIAAAPTYAQVGIAAPIILVLARIVQGLSIGGEYGSSATYLSEMAPDKGRGFWSSFQYATLLGGQLLALLVSLTMQLTIGQEAIRGGAWRFAFVIGAMLAVGVFMIRRNLAETRAFENLAGSDHVVEDSPSTLRKLWRDHKRSVILVAIMSGGGGMASYAFTTYMLKFLQGTAKFDELTATFIMMGVLLWSVLMQPVWGAISDRIGRKRCLMIAGVSLTLLVVPVFSTIAVTTVPLVALLILLVLTTLQAGYGATNGVVKAELFPPYIRALGVAFPYAVGNTVLAGSVEFVALSFKKAGHESGFYWYAAAVFAVMTCAFWMLPETRGRDLEGA
ncbi:MFS transporter [Sphingomonas sp. SUN039]|uniref:MFS transporter n=1 Tax=Sphingomonas sp. SUN039 TaxID=2937787 RepID=UPI002164A953|nr:MFS transporter [Sphingomonas sp. SUN039]UVO55070.1 MFS transporter [Sphingomonas sp. SUN039]